MGNNFKWIWNLFRILLPLKQNYCEFFCIRFCETYSYHIGISTFDHRLEYLDFLFMTTSILHVNIHSNVELNTSKTWVMGNHSSTFAHHTEFFTSENCHSRFEWWVYIPFPIWFLTFKSEKNHHWHSLVWIYTSVTVLVYSWSLLNALHTKLHYTSSLFLRKNLQLISEMEK